MNQHLLFLLVLSQSISSSLAMQQSSLGQSNAASGPVLGLTSFNSNTNTVHSRDGIRMLKIPERKEDVEMNWDERPYQRVCAAQPPEFPLTVALAYGDTRGVIEYYSNWHGLYLISDYQKSIAKSLEQAAQLPPKKVLPIIAFLLQKLDPTYIERVDCLLDAAADNGHLDLIQYIAIKFEYQYTAWSLLEAVTHKNIKRLESLLKAGLSAEKSIGTHDVAQVIIHDDEQLAVEESRFGHFPLHLAALRGYAGAVSLLLKHGASATRLDFYKNPPVKAALYGFNKTDTQEQVFKDRLFIIRKLLEAMPQDKRPLPSEVDLRNVPAVARDRVTQVFNSFLPPAPKRISMTEEFTPEKIEKIEKKLCLGTCLCITIGTVCGLWLEKKCSKDTAKEESSPKPKKALSIATTAKYKAQKYQRKSK